MAKKRKAIRFTVSLVPPEGATIADVQAYVLDAVATMKGCYRPDNPISELDGGTVRVTRQYNKASKP